MNDYTIAFTSGGAQPTAEAIPGLVAGRAYYDQFGDELAAKPQDRAPELMWRSRPWLSTYALKS